MKNHGLGLLALCLVGCGDGAHEEDCSDGHIDEACPAGPGIDGTDVAPLAHTLYVAHEGSLVSYDIATGDERPGTVTNVTGPVDMQALADGTLMVNLTGRNEVLILDGHNMLEIARVPTSSTDGVRPVHSYLSPVRDGKQYWISLNDGMAGVGNSAAFIDVTPGSATRFERVGELALGKGHHKASFSSTTARVVMSNIADCENVLTVYDYSDLTSIKPLATLTGAQAGFDAADPGEGNFDPKYCDPTYQRGLPPSPHGCATSTVSGKVYCNVTNSGGIAVVDIDAAIPSFQILPTSGKGGGKTYAHPDGRYLYSSQEEPRGGCNIGQLVVIDAMTDTVVKELPLGYTGPGCTTDLAATAAKTANPDHLTFAHDKKTLYVGVAGGFGDAEARVDQVIVVDTSDPANPVQLPSLTVGLGTSHSSSALSGNGAFYFHVNSVDGTISQIATDTNTVAKTLKVQAAPKVLATFGSSEGPSAQTGPIH